MLPSFCQKTVTVIHPGKKQSRGKTVDDWETATETQVAGCSIQPASTSTDFGDARQQVTSGAVLYLPPGAAIARGDRIECDGRVWKTDGEPQAWESPTGALDHIVIALVDWSG